MRVSLRSRLAAIACLLVSALATPAIANDTAYGDDNGRLVWQRRDDVRMESEVLTIGEQQVTVAYVFRNTSAQDTTVPVAFPMPPVNLSMDDRHPMSDFRLWVDDVPMPTERRWVVEHHDGTDLTARVLALGWTRDALVAHLSGDALPAGRAPLPPGWVDADGTPRVDVRDVLTWRLRLPAGQPVTVRHAYAPSVSVGVPRSMGDLVESFGADTCIDAAARAGIRKREGPHGARWAHLRYVLTTATHWQGPIGDFTLRIRKQSPSDLVSLCFEGELKKLDPLTFEHRSQDFRPTRDLSILFVHGPGE